MAASGNVGGKTTSGASDVFFDALKPGSVGPITVLVCHRWDSHNENGRFMSTDFIVSDQKGKVMHATARNNIAHYFVDKLQEGSLYSLKNFTILPNREEYRITKDGLYIIELQGSTVVRKAAGSLDGFVRHPFELVSFEDLEPTGNKYFVDVVGCVGAVGAPSMKSNGRQTVDFNLCNERSQQVRVTLWGSLGDLMIEKKKEHEDAYPVILTSMSAKHWNTQMSLSSSSATLIIDNQEIPAIKALSEAASGRNLEVESAPIVKAQRMAHSIAELLDYARDDKDQPIVFRNSVEITDVCTKKQLVQLYL